MDKVDVCVVTLRGLSEEFYTSLNHAIPVSNVIIDSTTTPLGKAREAVIKKVQTERFVFVDDDVYLPQGWYELIMKYWTPNTGWLEGWALPMAPEWYRKWSYSRFKRATALTLGYGQRGFTMDTIIKTSAISDWNSPADLDFYEDLAMSNHVNNKGLTVTRAPVASEHRIPEDHVWKQADKAIEEMKTTLHYGRRRMIRYGVNSILSGLLCSAREKDSSIAYNAIKFGLKYMT
ncbi:MAG: glycosyltransferase family A protein [Nitrososphaerales archaeon]